MLNVVTLMGRLTMNPELKTTVNGISFCSFSIAVNRSYVKQGEERTADFINIVAWRNTAEFLCKYFTKGQMVAVTGSIQTRSYEDKSGNKRTAFEVIADNVYFTESKASAQRSDFSNGGFNPSSEVMDFSNSDDNDFIEISDDSDLPF